MAVRVGRQTISITLETGSANSVALEPLSGDWTISGFGPGFLDELPIFVKGAYQESVSTEDTVPEFAVSVYHDGALSSAALATVYDILMHAGTFAPDVTTDIGCTNGPWHLKVTIVVTGCDGDTDTFVMPNVRVGFDYASAKEGNTLSLSGKCYRGTAGSDPVQVTST